MNCKVCYYDDIMTIQRYQKIHSEELRDWAKKCGVMTEELKAAIKFPEARVPVCREIFEEHKVKVTGMMRFLMLRRSKASSTKCLIGI